ncbi:MAG: septum formation initiator family protein [Erysipelotrichaceae bacterium]|nr:septum formation initiator family protein [Erysipelotrichaceae bacterium]
MSTTRKEVKKKKKQLTPIFKLFLLMLFALGIYFSYRVIKEVYTTIQLRSQLAKVEVQLREIQDENLYLTSQKEKLEDPDYVQSYARGNYMLTKDGEEIYYLPANEDK